MMTENRSPKTEGQVVYRRVTPQIDVPPPKRERRFDPALLPLIIGFAILLLLVLVQGNLSVRRLEDTSRRSLQLEQSYATRASLLLRFRVALTQLDNEARVRAGADARRELRPPFDLRLDTARGAVTDLLPWLDHPPISDLPKWRKFHTDLSTYLDTVADRERYTRDGFTSFRAVDNDLNDLIAESGAEEHQIASDAEGLQAAATRSIRLWNIGALITGFAIAILTIWEVQRRFRQTKLSTEAARREREFSNQMLEGMVSAIAAIDRRDRIRSANAAFFRIFPRAAIGSSIHDDVGSPSGVKLLEAATASHVVAATYRGRWPLEQDDATITFDVYSSPLEIDGEHGQILTLVDVTEATKAESLMRRTEALAAVGSAAAQLAHEIKNPLGSIRLGVEMLRQYTSPEAESTISLVERGIHHLNKLVVDVTQFARHRQLDRVEIDLRDVINSSVELVMDRVHEKETPLTIDFDEEVIRGAWDESQLREVFVNLLANAIDASQPKSPVTITTRLVDADGRPQTGSEVSPRNARARILIADEGSGMDQKTLARLFEPFFTTKKRGTGLGLSIVRQIIDLHGGSIDARSKVGEGTTFRIDLPLNSTM